MEVYSNKVMKLGGQSLSALKNELQSRNLNPDIIFTDSDPLPSILNLYNKSSPEALSEIGNRLLLLGPKRLEDFVINMAENNSNISKLSILGRPLLQSKSDLINRALNCIQERNDPVSIGLISVVTIITDDLPQVLNHFVNSLLRHFGNDSSIEQNIWFFEFLFEFMKTYEKCYVYLPWKNIWDGIIHRLDRLNSLEIIQVNMCVWLIHS